MTQGEFPFMDSLKVNTMCLRTFKQVHAKFDPEGRFAVRDPLQQKDGRAASHITYPLRGEDVMFCKLVSAGMRLPLAPQLIELLQCYHLAPASLAPYSFLKWTSFIQVCKQLGVTYSLVVFRCLFCLFHLGAGIANFRGRKFDFKGPEARARGVEMRWTPMSFVGGEWFDDSSHYRERYFMYRGLVDWEVNPTDQGCPALSELSEDDIRCLNILCKYQKFGKLRQVPWKDLMDQDLSIFELELGSQVRVSSVCI